jgi:ATP-dependent Clp protease adaptor protein ClpS
VARLSAPGVVDRPVVEEQGPGTGGTWIVTVFNNDVNTYEEVMEILMRATGCDEEEAWIETWEIDHLGKSVVHHAAEAECVSVAQVISQIGIRVEVSQE